MFSATGISNSIYRSRVRGSRERNPRAPKIKKNIIRPATAYGRDLTAATQRNPRAPKIDKHKILLTTARYGTRRFFTSTTGPMFDEAGAVSSSRSSATMTGGGIEGSGPRRW